MTVDNEKHSMGLLEHVSELRIRLLRMFVALVVCFLICFTFSKQLLHLLSLPLEEPLQKIRQQELNQANSTSDTLPDTANIPNLPKNYRCDCQSDTPTAGELSCICQSDNTSEPILEPKGKSPFVFLQLTDVFLTEVKVAFWLGLFLAMPYLLGEIWLFVAPAMYKKEKKVFIYLLLSTIVCFALGAMFCYFVVFPNGFSFLINLAQGIAEPSIAISNYLDFALMLLFVFGIVFELPVLCTVLALLGIISAPWMLRYSRFIIVFIFFIAAIFTPPDPLSMIMMGVPLVGLYFLSYLIVGLLKGFKENALE